MSEDLTPVPQLSGHPNTVVRKERMIKAMNESLFTVSKACKRANINRAMHYRWMKEDAVYAERISEAEEELLDMAEEKLIELIKEKDPETIRFFLRTKGKKRGYSDKDIEIGQGATIKQVFIIGGVEITF